jgi:hypothetical protein
MELLNLRWIFQNYFIRAVFRRWYVVLAAFAGLWGTLEIWTRENQEVVIGIAISMVVGFLLLIPLLFLINAVAAVAKGIKAKSTEALCPECFDPMPIHFACQCAAADAGDVPFDQLVESVPEARIPYITYMAKGLFLNHCSKCSGEFFPRSKDEKNAGTLRGLCQSCGSFIKDWDFYMLHTGEVMVTIEDSLDNPAFADYLKNWDTGTFHGKIQGGEHYARKQGSTAQHWFRWGAGVNPETIPQNLTENIDYIWIDKELGSSKWQKTSTFLNYIRKEFQDITFGYMGSAEELRSGSLGIQESEITFNTNLKDFIEKQSTH